MKPSTFFPTGKELKWVWRLLKKIVGGAATSCTFGVTLLTRHDFGALYCTQKKVGQLLVTVWLISFIMFQIEIFATLHLVIALVFTVLSIYHLAVIGNRPQEIYPSGKGESWLTKFTGLEEDKSRLVADPLIAFVLAFILFAIPTGSFYITFLGIASWKLFRDEFKSQSQSTQAAMQTIDAQYKAGKKKAKNPLNAHTSHGNPQQQGQKQAYIPGRRKRP